MKDLYYMTLALKEAKKAYLEDEVPIGCVIVRNGEVIAKTHNKKVSDNCALSHAEILAIKQASEKINSWYLNECELYVTLEPCLMCAGAIINSRVKKVYFATEDPKGGAIISNIKLNSITGLNHYPEFEYNICKEESSNLLKDFFKSKRK